MSESVNHDAAVPASALVIIGLISASILCFEILLTRICALRLYFHFGYFIVSVCLLGIGASGSLIAIFQQRWRARLQHWLFVFSMLYLISLILTYAFLISFPIPADLSFNDLDAVARFAAFAFAGAVPVFFGASVVGLILTVYAERVSVVYAADMLGAGAGCLLAPFLLWQFGAGGGIAAICVLILSAMVITVPSKNWGKLIIFLTVLVLIAVPRVDSRAPVPGKHYLELTDSEQVVFMEPEYSRWGPNSRIDVLTIPSHQRNLFARGSVDFETPLPEQKFIMQDGSAGTYISNFSDSPRGLEHVARSMYSIAVQLKQRPRVLVIGVGGGNDLWAAKLAGAEYIKGVELNRQVIDVHREVLPHFSRSLLTDPSIELVHGEGRSELMRDRNLYDVLQMSGIDTWTALASGAYVLAENYLYTEEALRSMFSHLEPGGVLQIIRFSRDMEILRLLSSTHAAFQSLGLEQFENSILVFRTEDRLAAMLVKPGGFLPAEITKAEEFAKNNGIETVYTPSRLYKNITAEFVRSDDKQTLIEDFPRNISPTTDDNPYFFNYTKWHNPFQSVVYMDEPLAVSQGSPIFILAQLLLVSTLSFLVILVPIILFKRRGVKHADTPNLLIYFAGIGLGFIAIEITLMQKLTLLLGHPMYSLTVTLFSLLVFTGIGSLASIRWLPVVTTRVWSVPIVLAALLLILLITSPWIVETFVAWPLVARILVTICVMAPVGIVLGIPFAHGIRVVNRVNPAFVPWAWAVNGCFTVIGSVLTVIISMNLGFSFALVAAAVVHLPRFHVSSQWVDYMHNVFISYSKTWVRIE